MNVTAIMVFTAALAGTNHFLSQRPARADSTNKRTVSRSCDAMKSSGKYSANVIYPVSLICMEDFVSIKEKRPRLQPIRASL